MGGIQEGKRIRMQSMQFVPTESLLVTQDYEGWEWKVKGGKQVKKGGILLDLLLGGGVSVAEAPANPFLYPTLGANGAWPLSQRWQKHSRLLYSTRGVIPFGMTPPREVNSIYTSYLSEVKGDVRKKRGIWRLDLWDRTPQIQHSPSTYMFP